MRNLLLALLALSLILPATATAMKIHPGVGLGFSADGGTVFLVGGSMGFEVNPMFRMVFEGGYGRGGNANHFWAGGGTDIFFLPNKKLIAQPYAYGSGGYKHSPNQNGGYARFGGGVEFNLKAPVIPYAEIGGIIYFGGGTQGAFNLMGGIRFNM